jgi:hypothetical protein
MFVANEMTRIKSQVLFQYCVRQMLMKAYQFYELLPVYHMGAEPGANLNKDAKFFFQLRHQYSLVSG